MLGLFEEQQGVIVEGERRMRSDMLGSVECQIKQDFAEMGEGLGFYPERNGNQEKVLSEEVPCSDLGKRIPPAPILAQTRQEARLEEEEQARS